MAEYIECKALIKRIRLLPRFAPYNTVSYASVHNAIFDEPIVDVVEVKHGEWVNEGNYLYTCSLCGDKALLKLGGKPCNYCPNCGARMDGERRDEDG